MQPLYLLRNFVNLGLSALGVLFFLVVTAVMTLTNYLSCEFSFELLGYDKKPLKFDELVGPFLAAYLEKAQLVHLYSFMVAVLVTLGLFLTFRISAGIYNLYMDRRYYLGAADPESARIVTQKIVREVIWLVALAVPIYWAVHWDIQLFRVRSIAGVLGAEGPDVMLDLLGWEQQMEQNGQMWVWQITHLGAFGYLSLTAIACLGLEFSMRKISEHFRETIDRIQALFTPEPSRGESPDFYGYDENGLPVYDNQVPIAYDVNGNPIASAGEVPVDGAIGESESQAPLREAESCAGPSPEDPAKDGDEGPEASSAADHAMKNDASATVEVIGGREGKRVSLEAALADPARYWVDPNTQQVWAVEYRKTLFGDNWKDAV